MEWLVMSDYSEHLGGETKAVAVKPKIKLSVTKKTGSAAPVTVKEESKELKPVICSSTPAIITVSAGRTINLGDFNSAKVEVSLSYPCDPDDIENAYEHVFGWVDGKMETIMSENGLSDGD